MDFYKEYPIRCKTCGAQLACFAADYELSLERGESIENALNDLNIDDYCCRQSMMNPPIVTYNMENREVIEGFKSVEAVDETEIQKESTSEPMFSSCIGQTGLTSVPRLLFRREENPFIKNHPKIPELGLDATSISTSIPIDLPPSDKFILPTIVGTPTINPNILVAPVNVYVGAQKTAEVLNGRTYFAR